MDLRSVHYCKDRFHIHVFNRSSNIYDFHIFTTVYSPLHGFIRNQHFDQLPVGLLAQLVARALHRYRRGHGFKSCTDLNFFQAFFLLLPKKCSLLRRSISYTRDDVVRSSGEAAPRQTLIGSDRIR